MSLLDRTRGTTPDTSPGTSFWRTVSAGAVGGGIVGLLAGGLLGRLAMRVLTLTSPRSVRGRLTDDMQPVGQISLGGTMTLFVATAALGAVAGLVYLWVRRVLPPERGPRAWLFALLTGSVGGAFLVHDHPSFDYSALRPEWLSVLAFVVIPALFGLVAPTVIDRLTAPGGPAHRGPVAAWVTAGVVVLNLFLVVVAVPVIVAYAISRSGRIRAVWHGPAVTVAGRALFVLLVAWGVYGIATDIVSIATDTPSGAPLSP
jgi:hypothetical protein